MSNVEPLPVKRIAQAVVTFAGSLEDLPTVEESRKARWAAYDLSQRVLTPPTELREVA